MSSTNNARPMKAFDKDRIFFFLLLATRTVVAYSFVTIAPSCKTTTAALLTPRPVIHLSSLSLSLSKNDGDTSLFNSITPPSSPSSTSNELDMLITLCYASSLSYLPLSSIPSSPYSSTTPALTLTPLHQIVEPATESGATVFELADDTILVACRGSATPKNFLTNLRFGLEPLPARFGDGGTNRGKAHEGFTEAAEGLWERLEPLLLESTSTKGKNIVFTGHSLGGGTSELVALLYASATSSSSHPSVGSVARLTTFGGPCIGDSAFANYVNDIALSSTKITHVVHGADPILANNGPLWDKLGFVRSGEKVVCDPFDPLVYGGDGKGRGGGGGGGGYIPWNILDHCRYLGVYVGPRLL